MPEFQGPGPRPGWSPPPLKLSADAPFIGPVGPIVSGSQENLDLGIEGWHRGTSLLAQGLVPLLIVAAGQFNPQPVQAQIFKSQRTASVVAAPSTFVSGSQQRYVDSIGQVFASVRAGGTPTAPEWVSASPQTDPSQPAAIVFNSQPAAPTAASPIAAFFTIPPESIDLSIEGWHRGTSLLAQGAVPALTAARQDVADPIQGSVWPPARTQPVASSAVPAFTATTPQSVDIAQGWIWSSVRTPVVVSSQVPATIYASPSDTSQLAAQVWRAATTQPVSGVIPAFTLAAPELVDLGIEGWHRGVSLLAQGGVPQLIAAYSIPDTKQMANIWPSVRTPPAAASGDIVKPIFAAPQYPPYVAAVTWSAAVSPQGAGSSTEYRFGSHAVAIYSAEARKSRLFNIGSVVQPASGDLGTFVRAAPQLLDLALQARLIPAAITQPVQGAVPPLVIAGQPQESTYQIPGLVFVPLEFGQPTPGPVVEVPPSGSGWERKHHRPLPQYYRDIKIPDYQLIALPQDENCNAVAITVLDKIADIWAQLEENDRHFAAMLEQIDAISRQVATFIESRQIYRLVSLVETRIRIEQQAQTIAEAAEAAEWDELTGLF